jgi:hypothetical protein
MANKVWNENILYDIILNDLMKIHII